MKIVDAAGVRGLMERGAQIVEVLPEGEFSEIHLPGAVDLPLKELDRAAAGQLDRSRPVVVYCYDAL